MKTWMLWLVEMDEWSESAAPRLRNDEDDVIALHGDENSLHKEFSKRCP